MTHQSIYLWRWWLNIAEKWKILWMYHIFLKSQKCTWSKDVFDTILHWKRWKCEPKSSLYNLKGFPLCPCHPSYKARAKTIGLTWMNKTVIKKYFQNIYAKKCKLDKGVFCVAKLFRKKIIIMTWQRSVSEMGRSCVKKRVIVQ